MVTFLDDFGRSDRDLGSDNGWFTINTNGDLSSQIEILTHFAVNTEAAFETGAAQLSTVPGTIATKISAFVDCTTEGANAFVNLGHGFASGASDLDQNHLGFYVRLSWLPDGKRTLGVYHHLIVDSPNPPTPTLVEEVIVVAEGGVDNPNFAGAMVSSGAVNTPQLLMMVLTENDRGEVRVRAFLNTDSEAQPIIDVDTGVSWIAPNLGSNPLHGGWWFGFGPTGSQTMSVSSFAAEDYVEQVVDNQIRSDQLSLRDLRQKVRTRYFGKNDNRNDDEIDEAIQEEIDQIINTAGDTCWFLRRSEEVTLAVDADGLVALDTDVRRVLNIRSSNGDGFVNWQLHDIVPSTGALRIRIGRVFDYVSDSYWIDFLARHAPLTEDEAICPIPREHNELVVVGACVRLAERARNNQFLQSQLGRYQALMNLFRRDMNRYTDIENRHFQPTFRGRYLRQYRRY